MAAAPRAGAVVSAMAIDAAAGIITANRAVAHVAAYYGYDLDDPVERVLALGVLSMGLASWRASSTTPSTLHGAVPP